jgi:hypothetical protein
MKLYLLTQPCTKRPRPQALRGPVTAATVLLLVCEMFSTKFASFVQMFACRNPRGSPQQQRQHTPHRCCWHLECSCSCCPQKAACFQPPKPLPQSAQNASTQEPVDLVSLQHTAACMGTAQYTAVQCYTCPSSSQTLAAGLLGVFHILHHEKHSVWSNIVHHTLCRDLWMQTCRPLQGETLTGGNQNLAKLSPVFTCALHAVWLCAGARTRTPRHGSDATVECWRPAPV